jgi:hypothetical protein
VTIVWVICFCVCLFWNFNPSKAWNFNPSKAWNQLFVIVFRRVEISSCRRFEIKRKNRWFKLYKYHRSPVKTVPFHKYFLVIRMQAISVLKLFLLYTQDSNRQWKGNFKMCFIAPESLIVYREVLWLNVQHHTQFQDDQPLPFVPWDTAYW